MKQAIQVLNELVKNGSMKPDTRIPREVRKLFLAKRKRRAELAQLPIEQKIQILLRLQAIASTIRQGRLKAWQRPWAIHETR